MKLKHYQDQAIGELQTKCTASIARGRPQKIVFKSPTGSGKTIMMAELLRRLTGESDMNDKLAFIWVAPRKLHSQSMAKLKKYYAENRALECLHHGDLMGRQIGAAEILFLNWESINKKGKNILIRESEREDNLSRITENTRDEGRRIILVIDESHHHATTENAAKLVADLQPTLTIDVSATPALKDHDEMVSVHIDDVKEAGMIKKSVLLNDGIENSLRGDKIVTGDNLNDRILRLALAKRAKLAADFQQVGAAVNPLLLIQLPNRDGNNTETEKAESIALLKEYDITRANGKLAVYLSDDKENLTNIARNANEVEVMLFKQAIALGWDCPRAHILVLFREWHEPVFSVQTLGRIMRMPQPDIGHYQAESLNTAHVFTNLSDISIKQDLAQDYLRIYSSRRDERYTKIQLPSVYQKRMHEKTRLSPLFQKLFLQTAEQGKLKSKLDLDNCKVNRRLISDMQSENVDELVDRKLHGELDFADHSNEDLQKYFNKFCKHNIGGFSTDSESIVRARTSIYEFFAREFQMNYGNEHQFAKIIGIVLSDKNNSYVCEVLQQTTRQYENEVAAKAAEILDDEKWQVPEAINYDDGYVKQHAAKSIMQPLYIKTRTGGDGPWQTEAAFIEYIEKNNDVEWWFKNGDQGGNYFAVPYVTVKGGETHLFYVDFIVRFKSGRIGLYDTKGSLTYDQTKQNGLKEYAAKHSHVTGSLIQQNKYGQWESPPDSANEIKDAPGKWQPLELGG